MSFEIFEYGVESFRIAPNGFKYCQISAYIAKSWKICTSSSIRRILCLIYPNLARLLQKSTQMIRNIAASCQIVPHMCKECQISPRIVVSREIVTIPAASSLNCAHRPKSRHIVGNLSNSVNHCQVVGDILRVSPNSVKS